MARQHTKTRKLDRPHNETKVSIKGIFKAPKKQSHKKQKRENEETNRAKLVTGFQAGLTTAYEALDKQYKASFESTRHNLNTRLAEGRASDSAFLQYVSNAAQRLSTPLVLEQVEIESIRQGKRLRETITIGKRVSDYKSVISAEEAKLKDLWNQWDQLQSEYIELGIGVFGSRDFGENVSAVPSQMGYKKELEQLEKTHNMEIHKLVTKVDEVHKHALQRMQVSEKELNESMMSEQYRVFKGLMIPQ